MASQNLHLPVNSPAVSAKFKHWQEHIDVNIVWAQPIDVQLLFVDWNLSV